MKAYHLHHTMTHGAVRVALRTAPVTPDALPYNLHRVKISSVVATAYGGPEVLSVVESNLNDPSRRGSDRGSRGGDQSVDYKLYSGTYGDDPSKLPMSSA